GRELVGLLSAGNSLGEDGLVVVVVVLVVVAAVPVGRRACEQARCCVFLSAGQGCGCSPPGQCLMAPLGL
ncbi:hypothetical protein O3P69_020339, partial [Scylla paramamosain]